VAAKSLLPTVLQSHSPTTELTKHEELYHTREDQPFIHGKYNYTFKILQLKFKQVLKWCVNDRTDHYADIARYTYYRAADRSESKVLGVEVEEAMNVAL
jgi:hypothetical protein